MKKIFAWLLPRKSDFFALAILILFTCSVLVPQLRIGLFSDRFWPMLALFSAALFAFCATIGTWNWRTMLRRWPILLAVVASYLTLVTLSHWLKSINLQTGEPVQEQFNQTVQLIGAQAVIALVAAVVFSCLMQFLGRGRNQFQITRQKVLIAGAIALLILQVGFRLMQDGLSAFPIRWSFHEWGISNLVMPVFLASIPVWVIGRIRGFWLAVAAGIVYLAAASFALFTLFMSSGDVSTAVATRVAIGYGLAFLLVAFLIREPGLFLLPDYRLRPMTIWGWVPLGVTIAGTLGTYFLDPIALATWTGKDRLGIARAFRKIQMTPDTQTSLSLAPPGFVWLGNTGGVYWHAGLTPETPVDYFSQLPDLGGEVFFIEIHDIQPTVDTSRLNSPDRANAYVNQGTLTPQQFVDLVDGTISWVQVGSVDAVDGPLESSIESVGNLALFSLKPGAVAKLLPAFAPDAQVGTLRLSHCELNDEDWRAIFKISRTIEVQVWISNLTDFALELAKQNRGNKLTVTSNGFEMPKHKWWDILLNTDIGMVLDPTSPYFFEPIDQQFADGRPADAPGFKRIRQMLWDAIFAANGKSIVTATGPWLPAAGTNQFRREAVQLNWAYGPNTSEQNVEHILLPVWEQLTLNNIAKFKELKSVSLDQHWLKSMRGIRNFNSVSYGEWIDLMPFRKLTKLERLYLPPNLHVEDYSFLSKTPLVQHLQFEPKAKNPTFKAALCPNLKSIRLFARPDPRMLRELGKITTLQQIAIVDFAEVLADPAEQDKVRRLLPENVQLTVVPLQEYTQVVPREFIEHQNKIRDRARQKYQELPDATESDGLPRD